VCKKGKTICAYSNLISFYGGTVGLCWNDNYSTTYIYKYLLMSKLYGEVAAYLPFFYRLLLSDVDCGVELRCYVVMRPPVGRER